MRIIIKSICNYRYILIILIIAGLLRITNPFYASPTLYVIGDEPPNYMGALYVLANKNLLVRTAIYPPFGSYAQIPFLLIAFLLELLRGKTMADLYLLVLTQPGFFLFVPRILAGIFGTATIYLIYKISKLVFPKSKSIRILAALLAAFLFNHGQISHFGRPWAAAMFFYCLSLKWTLQSHLQTMNDRKLIILASAAAIVSYGFHQVGVFALWSFAVLRIVGSQKKLSQALIQKNTWLGIIMVLIGIGCIYGLQINNPTADWFPAFTFYPPNYGFINMIIDVIFSSNIVYNIRQLLVLEPIVFIFFLINLLTVRKNSD